MTAMSAMGAGIRNHTHLHRETENMGYQQSRLAADINETIRAFAAREELPLHIAKQALEDAMTDVEGVLMKEDAI